MNCSVGFQHSIPALAFMLRGWGSPDNFRWAPLSPETTVKANLLCKNWSSGGQIHTEPASKLDPLTPKLSLPHPSLSFHPFFFYFNSFNDQKGGNPRPYVYLAEDVFTVIDLTEGGYAFGTDCKEQWKGMDINPTKTHPALINKIDLVGSQ